MRALLNRAIDSFQAKFPPNRLVALAMGLLVPFVITPAAAFLAAWVPAHFPGLPAFSSEQLTAYGILGAGAALLGGITAGYKYIDGWQFKEARDHGAAEAKAEREHEIRLAVAKSDTPMVALDALEELEGRRSQGGAFPSPAPGSPSAAVGGAVAPPPVPPAPHPSRGGSAASTASE